MNRIDVEQYGRHSYYVVLRRIDLEAPEWRLLQNRIDRWYTFKEEGGMHRSLVTENNLYGHAHRAGQVVYLPSCKRFIRSDSDRSAPWGEL